MIVILQRGWRPRVTGEAGSFFLSFLSFFVFTYLTALNVASCIRGEIRLGRRERGFLTSVIREQHNANKKQSNVHSTQHAAGEAKNRGNKEHVVRALQRTRRCRLAFPFVSSLRLFPFHITPPFRSSLYLHSIQLFSSYEEDDYLDHDSGFDTRGHSRTNDNSKLYDRYVNARHTKLNVQDPPPHPRFAIQDFTTMSSLPNTPAKESKPSRWGRVVRRSTTLLSGGSSSREASRPGTPGSELAANPTDSATNNNGSNTNVSSPTPKGAGSKDDDDAASIKSSKSGKGSFTSRLLGRSGSSASLKGSLKRGKTVDSISSLNTSEGGLAPPPTKASNPAIAGLMLPSPIAESPNREAMETPPAFSLDPNATSDTAPPATGPSPLANQIAVAPSQGSTTNSASPTGYVAPPLLDSSVGNPGAFTDESDGLPQPTVIANPYGGGSSRSQVNLPPVQGGGVPASQEGKDARESTLPNPHSNPPSNVPSVPHTGTHTPSAPRTLEGGPSLVSTEQSYGEQIQRGESERGAFFGKELVESIKSASPSRGGSVSVSRSVSGQGGVAGGVQGGEVERGGMERSVSEGFKAAVEANATLAPKDEKNSDPDRMAREATLPAYEQGPVGNGGHGVWANTDEVLRNPFAESALPEPNSKANVQVEEPASYEPAWGAAPAPAAAPKIEVSRSVGGGVVGGEVPGMPRPEPATTQVMPVETHRNDHPTIFMPLPPFNSVVAAQPLMQPSAPTRSRDQYETDERRPLLGNRDTASTAKPPTAAYGLRPTESTDAGANHSPLSAWVPSASYSQDGYTASNNAKAPHGQGAVGVLKAAAAGNAGMGVGEARGAGGPKLHELGWFEYHLPDGSYYYVHPTLRVTTDVNLRNERVLEDVMVWLDANPPFGDHALGYGATGESFVGTGNGKAVKGSGVEVWLREMTDKRRRVRVRRGERVPGRYVRCWVDHFARTVVVERPTDDRKGKGRLVKGRKEEEEEDQLDMEYRYWTFMEAHPAHTVLPVKSKNEALEVLTWARTDHLLPSQKPIPSPFSPEECQELMTLLNSFPADAPDDNGIQTRVIARVLLRVAIWRQAYFRSNKPLPKDVKTPPSARLMRQGRSALRVLGDLVVVIMCLGLPYIFVERRKERIEYAEGWGRARERSALPVFVVGTISCLVAAVLLSASVTFISLPGMGGAARIAGFVAIACAVGSMLASVIAFIRFRSDLSGVAHRPGIDGSAGFVAAEGLSGITKRAVVTSLPLVFLAYSIIGFVVGLSIYSFRGSNYEEPNEDGVDVGAWMLGEGAMWTVLTLVGAAGGVVAMSWVVWRQ